MDNYNELKEALESVVYAEEFKSDHGKTPVYEMKRRAAIIKAKTTLDSLKGKCERVICPHSSICANKEQICPAEKVFCPL